MIVIQAIVEACKAMVLNLICGMQSTVTKQLPGFDK